MLRDVDSILDGCSLQDGHVLLRGMVGNLLREVDLLHWQLDKMAASLQRCREERDVTNNDCRDCLLSLILPLAIWPADHLEQMAREDQLPLADHF